jgi:hypothetical protein
MSEIPNKQEEVEIGKLFILLGKAINSFFKSISNLISKLMHFIILSLIFLKKNVVILIIATILGGALGYFLKQKEGEIYKTSMIVETNYGSGHQLYKQTDLINNLISEKEYDKLAKILNIPLNEAQTLSKISIEPYNKKENLLREFDYFLQNTDTIYTRDVTIEDFKKRYTDPDYRIQNIIVYGVDKNLFPKLSDNFLSITENKYFKDLLTLNTGEIIKRKKIIEHELAQIDSIRKVYKEVEYLNAKKNNSSSTNNINLLDKAGNINKDIDLFNQTRALLYDLKKVKKDYERKNFIVKPLSEFKTGEKPKKLSDKKWFKFAALGFLLAILWFLSIRLNKHLNTYEGSK